MFYCTLQPGSQYDTGVVNITSIVSVMGKSVFFSLLVKFFIDVKMFDNLIGWTLASSGDTMLE